jgi:hypothetical protein
MFELVSCQYAKYLQLVTMLSLDVFLIMWILSSRGQGCQLSDADIMILHRGGLIAFVFKHSMYNFSAFLCLLMVNDQYYSSLPSD